MATEAEFRRVCRRLRSVAPLTRPVKVSQCLPATSDHAGEVSKTGRGFVIRLRRGMELEMLEDTLIHEWAHASCWGPDNPLTTDHGPVWGVWYSQIYRAYHGVR